MGAPLRRRMARPSIESANGENVALGLSQAVYRGRGRLNRTAVGLPRTKTERLAKKISVASLSREVEIALPGYWVC